MDNDSIKKHIGTYDRFLSAFLFLGFWLASHCSYAALSEGDLSVWVNEAIVNTYTVSAENFLDRQKEIAKYFTNEGWLNYNKALQTAQLKESIEKNKYNVTAVALLPPIIKTLSKNQWQATMPLLVLYANPSYKQKQTLAAVITFTTAKTNEGVRGLALTSFNTTVTTPPCRCENAHRTNTIV